MKRKAIAIMRRSCSDSLLTASQMDGVFGIDSYLLPDFSSGATGISGRFTEGLLLRRVQP
jgi:hypothetical protein